MKRVFITTTLAAVALCAACNDNRPAESPSGANTSGMNTVNGPYPTATATPTSTDGTSTMPVATPAAQGTPAPTITKPNTPDPAPTSATPGTPAAGGMPAAGTPGTPSTPGNPNADNSANNAGSNSRGLTAGDQSNAQSDVKITQQIRQAVMADKTLSFMAKNVKIITIAGKVTLKGAVKTDQERTAIEAAAKRVAGDAQVDNQIEVKK